VIGLNMLRLWDSKDSLDEFIEPLSKWLNDGSLRPVVAARFPLADGPAAHRYVHARENIGKVVLEL
jgi:NADPH:quinone reductase-like Zn-dependent oxidoreductase